VNDVRERQAMKVGNAGSMNRCFLVLIFLFTTARLLSQEGEGAGILTNDSVERSHQALLILYELTIDEGHAEYARPRLYTLIPQLEYNQNLENRARKLYAAACYESGDYLASKFENSKLIEDLVDDTILADVLFNRGLCEEALENLPAAITDYTKSIELRESTQAYVRRALAKESLEDFRGAIRDISKAILLDDSAALLVRVRAGWYYDMRDYNSALSDCNKWVELTPDDGLAYFKRGLIKIQLGQTDEGCADLSISGEKGYSEVYSYIGKLCTSR